MPGLRWRRSKPPPLLARCSPRGKDVGPRVPERLRAGMAACRDAHSSRGIAEDLDQDLQQAFAAACRWSSYGQVRRAFLRPEEQYPDLVYKVLIREPLIAICRAIIVSRRARPSASKISSVR